MNDIGFALVLIGAMIACGNYFFDAFAYLDYFLPGPNKKTVIIGVGLFVIGLALMFINKFLL